MNKNNIFIESSYEFKRTRRSILFRIFAVLAILGLVFYQFTFLSRESGSGSIRDLFLFYIDWPSQALSSSIALKSAYYFNMIQLLFIVCFAVNDSRAFKLGTNGALYARPQGNGEAVIGNFWGRLLVVTMLNWLLFAVSIVFNLALYPGSFDMSCYLFYWITLTFPASVYFLGISYLVSRFVRNLGISFVVLFLFLGGITFRGAVYLHGLFDPCARYIPNMFSDFTGHVNLGNYLLQRGSILLTGTSFLVLSMIPYPRIPNCTFLFKRSLGVGFLLLLLAGGVALIYHDRHEATRDVRETYKQVYEEYGARSKARVTRNDLHVKELANGNISASSRMTLINRTPDETSLILYLNPGLTIRSLEIDGKAVSFQREHQAVMVDKKLGTGETCEVSIDYEGGIENAVCFLDVDAQKYNSPEVNSFGIYHYGYSPAFCEKGYKLLTPECIWYPVCVPPYGLSGGRGMNFTRYSLKVEHDPRLTAISQGNAMEEGEGKTSFDFTHDMPGISLCIGSYKKRTITVASSIPNDSTRLSLYYLPRHEYLLDKYDFPKEELGSRFGSIKGSLEGWECIGRPTNSTEEEWAVADKMTVDDETLTELEAIGLVLAKRPFDPTEHYPYRWLTLVEVPCNFHCFPDLIRLTGERVQGGIVFLPEKLYSIKDYQYKAPKDEEEKERMFAGWDFVLAPILGRGSCDVIPLLRGETLFVSSDEYPFMNDVIDKIAYKGLLGHFFKVDDPSAVEFLKANSLKDALHDDTLSPDELQNIIRKKSAELCMYIMLQVERDSFERFYQDLMTNNLFKEMSLEEYFRQFHQSLGVRLDSLVMRWYNVDRLPVFDIRDARTIKLRETHRGPFFPDVLYNFKVFNTSDVPGLIMTTDFQGWIIPPHEGREIRTPSRTDGSSFSSVFYLEMPLAQNLPAQVTLRPEEIALGQVDTTVGVARIDSAMFFRDKNVDEIIVDNEDPGFRVVKAKGFNILSFFREETGRKKYGTRFSRQDAWVPVVEECFYGFSVRSAFFKKASSGKQKVEWNARLPREGKYEVFFYHVEPNSITENPYQELYYVVFDGKEEHEVIASVKGEDVGWISLGVFDFTTNAKVALSDRDRKNKVETEYGCFPQEIVADAIKWVKK